MLSSRDGYDKKMVVFWQMIRIAPLRDRKKIKRQSESRLTDKLKRLKSKNFRFRLLYSRLALNRFQHTLWFAVNATVQCTSQNSAKAYQGSPISTLAIAHCCFLTDKS